MEKLFQIFSSIVQAVDASFRCYLCYDIDWNNKKQKQIAGIPNAFIAADNIEYPHKNTIPIWMFGFLY